MFSLKCTGILKTHPCMCGHPHYGPGPLLGYLVPFTGLLLQGSHVPEPTMLASM